MQLIKNILNRLSLSKIFIVIVILWTIYVVNHIFFDFKFFWLEYVFAADGWQTWAWATTSWIDSASNSSSWAEWFIEKMSAMLKAVYVVLWPLLMIAWKSLDNSIVYWEIFHLDKALWMFWNMMKNFANYALWFIFLISILMYFFYVKSDRFEPKKVIPQLLIWAVWIQASWWIVWALIDLSTIWVFALWAMPLNILKWGTLWDSPILQMNSTLDLSDIGKVLKNQDVLVYYSYWTQNFIPCVIEKSSENPNQSLTKVDETIMSRIRNEYKWINIDNSRCVYNNLKLIGVDVDVNNKEAVKTSISESMWSLKPRPWSKDLTLGTIVSSAEWMTWPLYTLYSSILSTSWFIVEWSNKTTTSLSLIFMMKLITAIALIVPLITLVVVLIMRVVVLWLIIWFSPIIVLSEVFSFKLWWEKATLKSVIWLIFLPVTAVFAMSLSLLFLTLLNTDLDMGSSKDDDANSSVEKAFGFQKVDTNSPWSWVWTESHSQSWVGNWENVCYEMLWLPTKFCFKKADKDSSLSAFIDIFPWLIINFLGIGFMWTIVFAAMKTSAITNWIVTSMEWFGKQLLKSAPIIPIPWSWMQSIWSLKRVAWELWRIPETIQAKQFQESFQDTFDRLWSTMSGDTWRAREDIAKTNLWADKSQLWTIAASKIWASRWWSYQTFANDVIDKIKADSGDNLSWINSLEDLMQKHPDLALKYWIDKLFAKPTNVTSESDKVEHEAEFRKSFEKWFFDKVKGDNKLYDWSSYDWDNYERSRWYRYQDKLLFFTWKANNIKYDMIANVNNSNQLTDDAFKKILNSALSYPGSEADRKDKVKEYIDKLNITWFIINKDATTTVNLMNGKKANIVWDDTQKNYTFTII